MSYSTFPVGQPIRPALEAAIAHQWRLAVESISNFSSQKDYNLATHRWHFFALRACFGRCEPLIDLYSPHTVIHLSTAVDGLIEFQDSVDWEFFMYLGADEDHQYEEELHLPRQHMRHLFTHIAKLYNAMMESEGELARVPFVEWKGWVGTDCQDDCVEVITSAIASCNLRSTI